ncbi:MAG: fimbrillin family protein [Alistipes sp.]|nr:fimbrillin family protein [Alistipes sp.]
MKRLKNKIYIPAAVCIAAVAAFSCTRDNTVADTYVEGTAEIRVKGISDVAATRIGADGEAPPVYLVAFPDGDMSQKYFDPTRIISASSLNTTPTDLTVTTKRYYPLGNNQINLFAYTGSINSDNEIGLMAGQGTPYDFILSNVGQRSPATVIDWSIEGEGTPGSSENPAEILQFRHIMTKLNVLVEVDTTEEYYVDPPPSEIIFEMDGVYENGYYPVTGVTPDESGGAVDVARNNGTTKYKVQLGENFLIPTGIDLVGKTFSYLKIDEYIATDDDLKEFEITGEDPNMYLYSGYAYNLTFKIQKLRVVGVVLEQVDWDEIPVDGHNPTYDPAVLTLDIGGEYDNSGDDLITRVVLHTTDNKQYVGQYVDTAGKLNYITLPDDNQVDSVDLYTAKGLLISMPVDAGDYSSQTLSFELSAGGMQLENPQNLNSALNPYLVTTLVQFMNIEKDLGAYYRQEVDIEFNEVNAAGGSSAFTGFSTFRGQYDGNSKWIGNIDAAFQGLFAENHGTLLNIRLYTGNIDLSGYTYAGAICGINSGTIYACINEASLFGATGTVGGICGLNEAGGRVIACVNTGNIWAGTTLGGICGRNESTAAETFLACLSTGNIYNGGTSGAIIGSTVNAAATAVINTCYWLSGSVASTPGGAESAVGSGTIVPFQSAALSPDKMRDGIDDGESDSDRIVNILNAALTGSSASITGYLYYLDEELTGITWPMPFNTNNI